MCAVEAQRCVDCVSAVLHAVLTRAATLRALSTPTGMLGVPGPDAPLWTIDLLVSDNGRDPTLIKLVRRGSCPDVGDDVENVAG